MPARSGEFDLDPQEPRLRAGRRAGRRDGGDPRPARDRDAVTASGDATFEGMRDGYAAFQVGSGTYVFHAAM